MTAATFRSAAPETRAPATEARRVSGPKLVLHLEGLALFAAATVAYFTLGHGWVLFVSAFFAPDLSMLGYGLKYRTGFRDTHLHRV